MLRRSGFALGMMFAVLVAGCDGSGKDEGKGQPSAAGGDAPPAALLGTWELTKQGDQDWAGKGVMITFTQDGQHTWGPYMQKCTYRVEAPDAVSTDCTKSVPDFKISYKLKSVDATTLVLVNEAAGQTNTLTRK